MKKVLIISPYFAPFNTPDMQRIRMSLPYFASFDWEAEVVTVDERYVDKPKDELLSVSIPNNIKIHKVKALSKRWTSKIGLGSIALRSLPFFRTVVDKLLQSSHYDLIYFSTTQFPVCTLGAYWKKRFGLPYVIDMQDPWHSDYYQDKPKTDRPPKYWFSYRLNRFLEPMAMKSVDGLISVSQAYINELRSRYPSITNIPAKTVPFGAFAADMNVASSHVNQFPDLLDINTINLVYIGRGGADMHKAITPVFKALLNLKADQPDLYDRLKVYFIGTSYAPAGDGVPTISPLADQYQIKDRVIEITDRISYYHALTTMQKADALLITGSDDPQYSASKLYPYLLANKPVLALFHPQGPVRNILDEYGVAYNLGYDDAAVNDRVYDFITKLARQTLLIPSYNQNAIEKYSARETTRQQCRLFEEVVK